MPVFWANILAKERVVPNQGGTSSGKSQALVRVCFCHALMEPGIKVEVVGATIPDLTGDTLEIAEGLASTNELLKSQIKAYNIQKRRFLFLNGSQLVFNSYEDAKKADGPKRHYLYLSEARKIDWPIAYQLILRTTKKVYLDYNPVEQFWVHEKIINCQPNAKGFKEFDSVKVIRSWHIHNNFISEEQHNRIENISDPEMFKAYARGLTAKLSGTVYPNFTELERRPEGTDNYWGIDFGFTNDPTVPVKIWDNVRVGDVVYDHVVEILAYQPELSAAYIGQVMNENGYRFGQPAYIDHVDSMQRNLRMLRIVAIKAAKGKGSVEDGILHLRSKKIGWYAATPELREAVRNELKKYVFLTDKEGNITNKPIDNFNHFCDAVRYGVFTHALRTGKIKGQQYSEGEG